MSGSTIAVALGLAARRSAAVQRQVGVDRAVARRRACCAWVARPGTWRVKVSAPAAPVIERAAGRLGDDAGVAGVAAPQRAEGAEPAVLLADDEVQRDAARAAGPRTRGSPRSAARLATTPAFMSQAPRPCTAVRAGRLERVAAPRREVAGRDDVDVALEHQRRPGRRRPCAGADEPPRLAARRASVPGKPGAARERRRSIGHRSTSRPSRSGAWRAGAGRRTRRRNR